MISITAKSATKYNGALTDSGAYTAHLTRERLLNQVATDSKSFVGKLDAHTIMVHTNEGVATGAGGAVGVGSLIAAAPFHAMLGPFAAISVPLHVLGVALAPAAAAGGAASVASRAIRASDVRTWNRHFENLKYAYAKNADVAKQDRQSNAGLRRAAGDETAHTHIKEVMNDVDFRAAGLLGSYTRVQPGSSSKAYRDAGVPRYGAVAFYARAEEHLFKERNLSN